MKGSESISILGFRVPTICGGKHFHGSKGSFVDATKGVKGSKWEPIGGISILGFRVPTTCVGKNFDDHI